MRGVAMMSEKGGRKVHDKAGRREEKTKAAKLEIGQEKNWDRDVCARKFGWRWKISCEQGLK